MRLYSRHQGYRAKYKFAGPRYGLYMTQSLYITEDIVNGASIEQLEGTFGIDTNQAVEVTRKVNRMLNNENMTADEFESACDEIDKAYGISVI